jgi:iron complex outermembrane recepter protein
LRAHNAFRASLLAAALATGQLGSASAQTPPLESTIVVTATRVEDPVDRVPADIAVIAGDELVARDSKDMASALSLVSGVEAPPGGDAGPSSAVPAFLGLHEFDAFALVVDGIPSGGAFNPMITTLDFNDVERVEVLKGAAPVVYGATSFVGVVQALHYPAGEAANEVDLAGGSFGSARGSASLMLPQWGDYRQSLAIDGQSEGYADPRENVSNGQLLYRGALDLGAGTLRFDADVSVIRDVPPSPIIRIGTALTDLTPINANFNPADARIDQDEYHLALGYSQPTAWGVWDTLVSATNSSVTDIRAFLHPDLSGTADTQNQSRRIVDDYVDTHLADGIFQDTILAVGADLLYGHGRQTTLNDNSAYTVPLSGAVLPPATSQLPVNEIGTVNDSRIFAGQYAQLDWKPDAAWDILGGVRLNETYENKFSTDLVLPAPPLAVNASKTVIRPTETIGASYRFWAEGKDEAVLYADFRDAFKPAALDFGPDYTPQVLLPETALSYEGGLKGAGFDGALTYEAELFLVDFKNLVIATSSGALANAAGEQLKGVEFETRYRINPDLALVGNLAYHDDRFASELFFDPVTNTNVNIAGKELPLSSQITAALGLLYLPSQGFNATLVAKYVGRRFLDEENTAPVGGYATLDATLGDRFGRYRVALEGTNLSNARPPVSASEFGSESFYLLPARTLWLRIGYDL